MPIPVKYKAEAIRKGYVKQASNGDWYWMVGNIAGTKIIWVK